MHATLPSSSTRDPSPETPDSAQSTPDLDHIQLSALDLILAGHSDQHVADTLKVHRTTITRWKLYHPQFRSELFRVRQEVFCCIGDRARTMALKALAALEAQLEDPKPVNRVRAAKAILSLARSNSFAPPPDPLDGNFILERHARALEKIDPKEDPTAAIARDFDRLYEIRTFMAQLAPQSAPAQSGSATKCIKSEIVNPAPKPQPTPQPAQPTPATKCDKVENVKTRGIVPDLRPEIRNILKAACAGVKL